MIEMNKLDDTKSYISPFENLPNIYEKENSSKNYYTHSQTSNYSFLKMSRNLRELGIKNHDFFLALYDITLIGVDPYDTNLSTELRVRVMNEVKKNFWYFIRECVLIPVSGGVTRYRLDRGNLATSWCAINSLSFLLELPRQVGKTVGLNAINLWLYNYAATNSQTLYMHKNGDQAIENLKKLKDMRNGFSLH